MQIVSNNKDMCIAPPDLHTNTKTLCKSNVILYTIYVKIAPVIFMYRFCIIYVQILHNFVYNLHNIYVMLFYIEIMGCYFCITISLCVLDWYYIIFSTSGISQNG